MSQAVNMSRAAKWVSNTLLVFVILTVAFFFITPHLLGVEYFTIYSGSMMPAISVGSVAVVKPIDVSDITAGEIITFSRTAGSDAMVTHRVVEVVTDGGSYRFRTAGDANESPDGSLVPAENVIGKVWFDVPLLGYLSSFVRTKLGFLLLMVVPAFFIIALELKEIIKQLRFIDKKPAYQTQPLRPAAELIEQPMMADLASIPMPDHETTTPPPVERPPELPLIENVSPSQETVVAEAAEEPAVVETPKAIETPKRDPKIQAEASRIVDEIIARVRAERAAKQATQ